jgi:hypothetical protein
LGINALISRQGGLAGLSCFFLKEIVGKMDHRQVGF